MVSCKCPICHKINDLKEPVAVYKCKFCTRTVRSHGFDAPLVDPVISIDDLSVAPIVEPPRRSAKKKKK